MPSELTVPGVIGTSVGLVVVRVESVLAQGVVVVHAKCHGAIDSGLRAIVAALIDLLGFLVASLTLVFGIFLCVGRASVASYAHEVSRLTRLRLV